MSNQIFKYYVLQYDQVKGSYNTIEEAVNGWTVISEPDPAATIIVKTVTWKTEITDVTEAQTGGKEE